MKLHHFVLLNALFFFSCTTTTTTFPDGRVVKTSSQDPAVVSAVVTGVSAAAIQAGTAYLKNEEGLSK